LTALAETEYPSFKEYCSVFLCHTFKKRNHHERETERIPQDSGLRVNPHARHLGQYSLFAAIYALSIFS